jgi:hypothetical protein
MVYNTQNYWGFGPFRSFGILKKKNKKKHDVSENGSVSDLKWASD